MKKEQIDELRDRLYALSPYDLASAKDDNFRDKIDEALQAMGEEKCEMCDRPEHAGYCDRQFN